MNRLPSLPGRRELAPITASHFEQIGYVGEESLLIHYWRLIKRDRNALLAILGGCLLVALLHAMLSERLYTATSRIQIDRDAAKVVNIDGVEGQSNIYNFEFYQTQLELLESRSLSEDVARQLKLDDDPAFLFPGEDANRARALLQEMKPEERLYQATEQVAGGTRIEPVPGSSVFAISYVSPEPARAAQIANATADRFIATNLDRRYEATRYAREFLENRLQQTREKLEESEKKAVDYARQQGLISLDADGDGRGRALVEQDLEQLSARLSDARAARITAEADYRSNRGGTAASSSLANETVNQLRRQRGELVAELGKLENSYGPSYPRITDLKAQIETLEQQISREENRVTTSVDRSLADRFQMAVAAEQSLQARVDRLKGELLDQKQRSIGYQILERDVDTNRALYEALLQRFKEVGIAGGVGTNNVSIVDRALVPRGPSSPNLMLDLMIGLVIGLIGCAALILVREQMEDSVVLPEEFDHKLGAPLLGTTPRLGKSDIPGELSRDKSALTEAYYSTLTSIQYSTNDGAPPSLLVTSTQSNEGKSTTAFALAKDLASAGHKVLLVDADMRKPSLHRVHNLKLEGGVSDYLTGRVAFKDAVHPSAHENLSLMTAGLAPPNPAELLNGDRFADMMAEANKQFAHVVVDGPPVLGLADAPLLARAVEGTVFVIEHGRTRATQARLAMTRLMSVKARIIGAILTKLDAKSAGYGDGYGYDYRYKGD